MSKNCKHRTCEGEYCRRIVKPKKRTRIRKVSKKREKINKVYSKERSKFLKEGDVCGLKTVVCTGLATCIHHTKSRGKNLINKKTWMKSCWPCNLWVEQYDEDARKLGLKKSKFY